MAETLRAQLKRPRAGEDQGDLTSINSRAAELRRKAEEVLEVQVSSTRAAITSTSR